MSVEQRPRKTRVDVDFMVAVEVDGVPQGKEYRRFEIKPEPKKQPKRKAVAGSPMSSTHTCDTLSVLSGVISEQEIPDFEDYVMDEVPGSKVGRSGSSKSLRSQGAPERSDRSSMTEADSETASPGDLSNGVIEDAKAAASTPDPEEEAAEPAERAPQPVGPAESKSRNARSKSVSVHDRKCANHPRWLNRFS